MYPEGLKILKNIFTNEELNEMEININNEYSWNFENNKKHYHYPKYVFENNVKNVVSGDCERKIKENKICEKCNCHMMLNLKNNNKKPEWINNLIIKKLINLKIIKNDWCNCITIIMYKEAELKPHFDSPHIFELPIITLRLLNDSIMSFDSLNNYNIDEIIQERGDISIMDGECAKEYDHSIKKVNNEKTISIVIRRIHPELIKLR